MARVLLMLATSLVVAQWAGAAMAQKRAVFLPFEGKGGAAMGRALAARVGDDSRVTVLDPEELFSMAGELGIAVRDLSRDPTKLSQAASAAQVDAVVMGRVTGKGRKARLRIEVYDGGTGQELRRLTIALKRGRLPKGELERTARRLVPAIEGGQWMGPIPQALPPMPPTGDDLAAPMEPPPPEIPRGGVEAYAEPPSEPPVEPYAEPPVESYAEPPVEPYAEPPVEPYAEPPVEPEQVPALPPPEEEPYYPDTARVGDEAFPGGEPGREFAAASLRVGTTLLTRSFDLEGVRLANGRSGKVTYGSNFFPGVEVRGELFPFAFDHGAGWLSGIGLEAGFQMGFLKSQIQEQVNRDGRIQTVTRTEDTSQHQMRAALVYRLGLFRSSGRPSSLELSAGYLVAAFGLAQGTSTYQSNDTRGVTFGALAAVPMVSSGPLELDLRLGALGILGSTTLNDNKRYPDSAASGYEVSAGLSMDYDRSFLLEGRYLRQGLRTSFDPAGDEPAATSQDVYHGFVLTLGFRV